MATDPDDETHEGGRPAATHVRGRFQLGGTLGAQSRASTYVQDKSCIKGLMSPRGDGKTTADDSRNGELRPNNTEVDEESNFSNQGLNESPDVHLNGEQTKMRFSSRMDAGLINLIIQFLKGLGLVRTAECLIQESCLSSEKSAVSKFKKCVLTGAWSEAEKLLPLLGVTKNNLETVQSLLQEQRYLELLEVNDALGALSVLRNELATSETDPLKFEYLSSLIMCLGAPNGFIKNPSRSPSSAASRSALLKSLQDLIPSVAEIPPSRLKVLINQALYYQISNCIYHSDNANHQMGLYSDHVCSRVSFPTTTSCVFEHHTDEVWFVSFSHNDLYLASASRDKTAIVWSIEKMGMLYLLSGHTEPVSLVAWSHDDTKLLTASNDNTLKLWDMKNGTCIQSFREHTASVTSCVWFPSDEKFVSGSVDKNIFIWGIDGKEPIYKWGGVRANDMSITRDGKILIVASDRYIRLYDLCNTTEIGIIFTESDFITSINMSPTTGYILINLLGEAIHLWDFENKSMIKRYSGTSNNRFVIRSCFGGLNDRFVLSGSEDSKIYVWHREKSVLIEVLPGHTGVVNCVSWCSSRSMFASASDDHTIRIWGSSSNHFCNSYLYARDGARFENGVGTCVFR